MQGPKKISKGEPLETAQIECSASRMPFLLSNQQRQSIVKALSLSKRNAFTVVGSKYDITSYEMPTLMLFCYTTACRSLTARTEHHTLSVYFRQFLNVNNDNNIMRQTTWANGHSSVYT